MKNKITVRHIIRELNRLKKMNTDEYFGTFDYEGFGTDVSIYLQRLKKEVKESEE